MGLETPYIWRRPHTWVKKWPSQKMEIDLSKIYRIEQTEINTTCLSYAYDSNDVVVFVTTCGSIHEEISGFVRLCPELCDVKEMEDNELAISCETKHQG